VLVAEFLAKSAGASAWEGGRNEDF